MRRTVVVTIAACLLAVGCGGSDLKGAPDVRGLSLPDARTQLRQAGYQASVTTDAMFGALVEEKYTVCDEDSPKGKLVPIKVNKQC